MNARLNHCISSALLLFALICGAHQGSFAQDNYNDALKTNLWAEGRNVNGLRLQLLSQNASYAELSGGIRKGDFHDSHESSNLNEWRAEAKTVTRAEKISTIGSFRFGQKHGTGMCGSMFTDPGRYPIDVLEFTPGTKILQEYSFTGGLAADLSDRWKLGGRIDFTSDNYAKRKDIRHTNYALDLQVIPSLMYTIGDLNLGLSWIFRKTSESIQAEQIGTSAESFYAFLDKGIGYGAYQAWDGSGVHLAETGVDRFPVREHTNGVSVQFQFKDLYAEAEYGLTSGVIGEKDFIWFKLPGEKVAASIAYKLSTATATHIFSIGYSWMRQFNYEYVLEKTTSGGVTTPQTYGSNKVFERRMLNLAPRYRYFSDRLDIEAEIGTQRHNSQSTLAYPAQDIESYGLIEAGLSAKFRIGEWVLGGLASYIAKEGGSGETDYDTSAIQLQNEPFRLTEWYNPGYEWETCSKFGADLSVKRYFSAGKADNLYIKPREAF